MIFINIALLAILNLLTVTAHAAAAPLQISANQQSIILLKAEMRKCSLFARMTCGDRTAALRQHWHVRYDALAKELSVVRELRRIEERK